MRSSKKTLKKIKKQPHIIFDPATMHPAALPSKKIKSKKNKIYKV
jgi:hypothetical protein